MLRRRTVPRRDSIENLSFWTQSDTRKFVTQHKELVQISKIKSRPADSDLLQTIRVASNNSNMRKHHKLAENCSNNYEPQKMAFELKGTVINPKTADPILFSDIKF